MAEEEKIREHVKQALEALTDKKKKWTERLRDFLWEILIIIIAVNITIWFHSWSDKRHDIVLEKNFLIGTKDDLNNIKTDLNVFSEYYQPTIDYYDSVWTQINEHRINKAFVDTNSLKLLAANPFAYDNSRFESFKSSGYLRLIENEALSKDITKLYSLLQIQVGHDESFFNERRQEYITYIGSKIQIDSSGKMYVSEILNNPDVKFQIFFQRGALMENYQMKQDLLQEIEAVINEIDQELKTRFKYEVKNPNR